MKRFKIKPGINNTVRIWVLEEKRGLRKWRSIFRHEKIHVVVGMKNHLLSEEREYTAKNNFSPEDDAKFFKNKYVTPDEDDIVYDKENSAF